ELEQLRAAGDRLLLPAVGRAGVAVAPRDERLLVGPVGHDEVAVLTGGGTQQLEAEEAGRAVHRPGPRGEPLLELGAGLGRHGDGVDLDHGHGPTLVAAQIHWLNQIRCSHWAVVSRPSV